MLSFVRSKNYNAFIVLILASLTLRTQKHQISGKVCGHHIPLDRFFVNSLADQAGEARVLITPNSGPRPLFRGAPGAPALQRAALQPAISVWQRARARAGISAPLNSGPRPLFRGAPGAPALQRAAPQPAISVWQRARARAGISAPPE